MNLVVKNLIFAGIIFLTIFLRLNYDTFVFGYNFDEFAMISIAKLDFPLEIIKASAQEDYHAPLYYLVAHFFSNLANNDLLLRLLNVFLSVINVWVFYKIGKLLIDKKFGLILSLFLCVNHLQISITNFIKFYCLAFLLFSISIYYLIKFIKFDKNEIKLGVANLFFILSNTFGFIWVFIEYLMLLKLKNKRKVIKSFLIASFGFILYLPILIIQTKNTLSSIISAHADYPSFSFFGFYNFLNDYFSPLINYSCNSESVEGMVLLINCFNSLSASNAFNWASCAGFILLSLMPITISLIGIFKAYKNKIMKFLLILSFINILFYSILIISETIGYIALYQFSIGLTLIIISCYGLNSIKNKKIKIVLISYLILSQLLITNVYPVEKRETKIKPFGNIDNYISQINDKTPIIMIEAGRFAKYYYKNKNIFAIDFEELQGSHSRKWIEKVFNKEIAKNATAKNFKDLTEKTIKEEIKNPELEKYLLKELISKVEKNQTLILAYNADGDIFCFNDKEIERLLKLPYNYKKEDSSLKYQINKTKTETLSQRYLGEVIHSYSIKLIIKIIEKYFIPIKIEQFIPNVNGKYSKHYENTSKKLNILDLMNKPVAGWIFVTYQKI